MTIKFILGNLFDSKAEVLVNPVNCVGVMGKGLALAFKQKFPRAYEAYKAHCSQKLFLPGNLFWTAHSSDPYLKYIVHFPTKIHWRDKSKLSFIEEGCDALVNFITHESIHSIAIPALGCGEGGLDWKDVKEILIEKLSSLEDISIEIYEPY